MPEISSYSQILDTCRETKDNIIAVTVCVGGGGQHLLILLWWVGVVLIFCGRSRVPGYSHFYRRRGQNYKRGNSHPLEILLKQGVSVFFGPVEIRRLGNWHSLEILEVIFYNSVKTRVGSNRNLLTG